MNIIVEGAFPLAEYKRKRAAITKLATQLSEQWGFGVPETAWMEDEHVLHASYPDGSHWKFTVNGVERE